MKMATCESDDQRNSALTGGEKRSGDMGIEEFELNQTMMATRTFQEDGNQYDVDHHHTPRQLFPEPKPSLRQRLQLFLINHNLSSAALVYTALFFISMVGHELALEAATKDFSQLESLAYAVTLFQFGFCVLLPVLWTRGKALKKFPSQPTDFGPYIILSIVVTGATGLATQAVAYVSYPTKVVFKSAKLIPTMMVATVIQRKVYGIRDYLGATLLSIGAAGYTYGSHNEPKQENNWIGILLLTLSVFCDALVPNLQKILMAPIETKTTQGLPFLREPFGKDGEAIKSGVSASELMTNVNAIGFAGVLSYMMVTGHLAATMAAAIQHPKLLIDLVLVGLGLSTAVLNYTNLIQSSGSVIAVAVATLRKVATVILSYVVFPKPLLGIHVISLFFVLSGIVLSSSKTYERRTLNRERGVTGGRL